MLLKKKEKEYRKKKIDNLVQSVGNSRDFWGEIKKYRRKKTCRGNISQEMWVNHFRDVLNQGMTGEEEQEEGEGDMDMQGDMGVLDTPITAREIREALNHLKQGKAAGCDGILNEMLKASGDVIMPFLVQFFNEIFDKASWPEEWTKALIVPIHKKGDEDNPDNYRGISLMCTLSKMFTRVINKRLSAWSEDNDVINEAQAGFRRNYSTVDHIFTLYACVEKQLSQPSKLYVAFVDFRKAYDSIKRSLLWVALKNVGIKGKMLTLLQSIYSSVQSCVRCHNGSLSQYFHCLLGLKQGCVLSPTLFSFFINSLAQDILSQGRHGVSMSPHQFELFLLLFADDLALMSTTPVGLQNQLNVLFNAAQSMCLNVNLSKTKVVVFRKGGFLAARERWFYGRDQLEVVNSYTYLGLNFSTMLSLTNAVSSAIVRAKRGTMEILNVMLRLNCNSPIIFFKLFDAQVVPMLMYAAEVWGSQKIDDVEKVHLFACKKFLGVSLHASNKLVYGELGRYPLYVKSAVRCLKYWFRLLKLPDTRYAKKAYDMLYLQDTRGRDNWVSKVKGLLFSNGFGYVWVYGGVGNERLFLKEFGKRLCDVFCQEWFSHMADSVHYRLYDNMKSCLEREKYISVVEKSNFRKAYARFRVGVSEINTHRHRFAQNANLRHCPFCDGIVEDEIHALFTCPKYQDLRDKYITFDRDLEVQFRLLRLFTTSNTEILRKVSTFIFLMLEKRRQLVNDA